MNHIFLQSAEVGSGARIPSRNWSHSGVQCGVIITPIFDPARRASTEVWTKHCLGIWASPAGLWRIGRGVRLAGGWVARWDWGTVHLNVATNITPEHEGEIFLDTIIEGPHKWTVRPVAELYYDQVFNAEPTYSALIGAIWQVNDKLSFYAGVRHALVSAGP
jgi:hypothetical protein